MNEPEPSFHHSGDICTLFEGDYHLGLAAFVNSLVRAGYKGTVWAGYRGALPPWIGQLERIESHNADEFRVTDNVRVVFLKLTTTIHLTNYKPEFMLNLLENEARDCRYLWYFDPDIFLLASWPFFRNWQSHGVALCQEIVDNELPADAPLRKEWMKLAAGIGFADPRPVNHYHNAGMVGVPAEHCRFLREWKRLIELEESLGYDLKYTGHGSREMPFNMSDQDALNIAIMYTKCPLTTLGPQGMGFIFGASMVMYHAVGQKPWRGSFLLRALKGMPPSGAMKFFLAQVDEPIRPYSPLQLRSKRLACSLATLIGRFYRRS
ncbi:MAG: hypothetical protein ABSD59_13010 [Terracidiphilus sp.]|jgi:hypothetical protein